MNKGQRKTENVKVRLPPELRKKLEARAEECKRSLSDYIRQVLATHIADDEENENITGRQNFF